MESSGKEDRPCPFCSLKCFTKSKLEAHITSHTREKPFVCDQCDHRFSLKPSLKKHIQTVHHGMKIVQKKIYKCSFCPLVTHFRHQLEIHLRRHTGERSFPCPHPNCEYAGKSVGDIKVHNNHKHTTKRNFLCTFPNCDYRGKTAMSVKNHSVSHSEYKPFVCDFEGCSFGAKKRYSLKYHQQYVHHGGFKPFACSTCNFKTNSQSLLKSHGLVHIKEKSIKCTFSGCSYSCKSKGYLQNHIVSRHQEKTFKCDFVGCLKTATSQRRLKRHKKDVHYDKVHKCPTCDYRAVYPSMLQKHMDSHNTSRRIPCPTKGCTFQAKHRESLRLHMRHHKANLGCPKEGCGHVAASKSGWKIHMKVHDTIGRPFHCPICPKRFASSSIRSMHLRRHTNEKPIKCPLCNFGATTKAVITRHVRSIHSNIFPTFVFDEESVCDHCNVNFGCDPGLAMHRMKLKTAIVLLTRLQIRQ